MKSKSFITVTFAVLLYQLPSFSQTCENAGIGTNTPLSRLEIRGCGNTSTTSSLNVTNKDSVSLLFLRDDGRLGLGITSPAATLHGISSGAKTAAWTGFYLSNTATSSTASVNKTGLDIQSTGTWNGSSAVNVGLNVSATGGTTNYAALFSGGNVGIGITAPTSIIHTVASGAKTANYTGNYLSNTATSSTASVIKYGLDVQSTGTWNGSGAANVGLNVNVTGGTVNYAALLGGGNVGIETTLPTNTLSFGGNSSRTLGLERHTTSNTSGRSLTISAGGAASGATDKNGGDLILSSGIATGDGSSNIQFKAASGSSSGTSDQTAATKMIITGFGRVGIGTTNPASRLDISLATGLSAIKITNTSVGTVGWAFYPMTNGSNTDIRMAEYTSTPSDVDRVTFKAGGSVGIGTTAPDQLLSVNGNASKSGGGSWATFSDEKIKKDVSAFTDGLDVIKKINPVKFKYKAVYSDKNHEHVGIIAQQMQTIAPYTVVNKKVEVSGDDANLFSTKKLVRTDIKITADNKEVKTDIYEVDVLSYDQSALFYVMLNAIKQLGAENEDLKKRIEDLEKK